MTDGTSLPPSSNESRNGTGNGTEGESDRRTDDIIVVTIWSFMLIYALVANVLVQIGILRSHSMRKATSYWLILSLSVCDIFMILISLAHLVPSTAFHDDFVQIMSPRNYWAIFFYDLFWYTGVLKLGLMAANRFVSIVYPTHYRQVFSPQRTMGIIAAVYAVGTIVSIPTLFDCCHTVWDHNLYVTKYVPDDTPYFIVDIMVNSVSLVMMIFCYAVIIIRVRESRKALNRYRSTMKRINSAEVQPNGTSIGSGVTTTTYAAIATPPRSSVSKREMRLFLQFFIVSIVFLGTWVTWQWLPRVSASRWIYFSMTSFFFINNGVNPTVYLIFNTSLRKEVKQVLCFPGRYFFDTPNGRRNPNTGSRGSTSDPSRNRQRRKRCPNSSSPTSSPTSSQHCNNNEKKKQQLTEETGVTLTNQRAEQFQQTVRKSISQAEEVERCARRSFSLCRSSHSINRQPDGSVRHGDIAKQRASCISLTGNPIKSLGSEPRRVSVIPALQRSFDGGGRKGSNQRPRIPFSKTVDILAHGSDDEAVDSVCEDDEGNSDSVSMTLRNPFHSDVDRRYSNPVTHLSGMPIDTVQLHKPSHLSSMTSEDDGSRNEETEDSETSPDHAPKPGWTSRTQPYTSITDSTASELHPLLMTAVIEEEPSGNGTRETESFLKFSPPIIRSSISADLIYSNPGTTYYGSSEKSALSLPPKSSLSLEDIEELEKYMVPGDVIVMTSTV